MSVEATLLLSGLGNDICSPFFNKQGELHAILQGAGEIIKIDPVKGSVETVHSTGGQPAGATFDAKGQVLYVGDFAHGAILAVVDGGQDTVVGVYEDKPLKGPNSVVAALDGTIFFSDSGPLGETGAAKICSYQYSIVVFYVM